jgi:ELWxxDGT repeat protein
LLSIGSLSESASSDDTPAIKGIRLASTADVISLRYDLPSLCIEATDDRVNGRTVSEAVMAGTSESCAVGEPVLPLVPVTIAVPYGYAVGTIGVAAGTSVSIGGSYLLEEYTEPSAIDGGANATLAASAADGSSADGKTLPESLFDVAGTQRERGVQLLRVNLNPVRYTADSGQLSYYTSLTLNVSLVDAEAETPAADQPRYRANDLRSLENEVANPDALATYAESAVRGDSVRGICSSADSYQYVIITSQAMASATTDWTLNSLVAAKQACGMSATIVTLENIYANYTGVDQPERIRNFIRDAYNNWETDFVLLGGDSNVVPYRGLWVDTGGGDADHIPSDLYYQCLDGNYNNDGDAYWGETTDGPSGGDVDFSAEVYIGRASAETTAEMANWVYKTIAYDQTATSDYRRQAMMVGEYLGFGGVSDYASASMEEIRLGSTSAGYSTTGFAADTTFATSTLYDSSAYTWSAGDLMNLFNSGAYGIYNHLGHANTSYVMKLVNSNVDTLTNDDFFFVYSQGCYPGDFPNDAIAEHFTTSTRTGAAAVIFNSRYGWGMGNSTDGPSQRPNREFWDALFGEHINQLGVMNADSHQDILWGIGSPYIRWVTYETTLFGDPAAQVVSLDLNVSGSTPADGATLATPPTDFSISFSEAYLTSSIAAGDLLVNGIAASSFTLTGAQSVTFHYNTSPVTSQGMQTMSLAADAVIRQSDNTGNRAWNATFRYDALPTVVTSTEPADGSTTALPLGALRFHFNEAIASGSLGTNDITLSHGTVTAAVQIDSDTIEYTLSGIAKETTLTVQMAAGAVTDLYGNPSTAYSGSIVLDYDTVPYTTPLDAAAPLGSLVYSGAMVGLINTAGDSDTFTIELDAGQSVTAVVEPASALQPSIAMSGPTGVSAGPVVAGGAGQCAVLQSVAVSPAGTYRFVVGGQSGTVGSYSLRLILNAAVENEDLGGPTNDQPADAQDLNPAFVSLDGTASRAAVLGCLPSPEGLAVVSEDFESGTLGSSWTPRSSNSNGRIQLSGEYGTAGGSYALLMDSTVDGTLTRNEATWTVDLGSLTQATLVFSHADWNDEANSFNGAFTDYYNADGVAISADGMTWHPVWNAPDQTEGVWTQYSIDLDAAAAAAGISLSSALRIRFQQYDDYGLTTDGRGYDQIRVTTPQVACDWYRLSLNAGESATWALAGDDSQATLALYYGGQLLAQGVAAENVVQAIGSFVATATGTYYVQVTGSKGGNYNLTAIRNAAFDVGGNSQFATAQDLTGTGGVLGRYQGGWTFMVYMTADNNLEQAGVDDFLEMASVGSTAEVNIVVQLDRTAGYDARYDDWTGTRRGLVKRGDVPSGSWGTDLGEVNMGSADSLDNFMTWARNAYPASHYALVLWDHGGGFEGVCFDDTDGDDLSMADLATAMAPLPGFSLIGFDACLMGMAEIAYQFRNEAQVLVASEETIPWDGYEYQNFLNYLVANPAMDARALAGRMLDAYQARYDSSGDCTLSAVDLTQLGEATSGLAGSLDAFAATMLSTATAADWTAVQIARDASQAWSYSTFRDLGDFVERVSAASVSASIAAAADDVIAALDAAVIRAYDGSSVYSTGVAVYLPGVGESIVSLYNSANLQFVADTRWEDFLAHMLINHIGDTQWKDVEQSTRYWEVSRRSQRLESDEESGGAAAAVAANDAAPGDWYRVNVAAGDTLTLTTATPAAGSGEFVNNFNPYVELYDSDGMLLAADDDTLDGRNARLQYTALASGALWIRVASSPLEPGTQGEYFLGVDGTTAALPPFAAAATDLDGMRFSVTPSTATVDFNDLVLLTSVAAADLRIDGLASPAITGIRDGDSLVFQLPAGLAEGWHTLSIAAGAIQDLQGTSINAFNSLFYLDFTAPRVIASTLLSGDVVAPGSLLYTMQFSEPLLDAGLDFSDVLLLGERTGVCAPTALYYDAASTTLTLRFVGAADDRYTLTFRSGDGQFEDVAGNNLDGEPSFPLPSGDGAAGGDFVVAFSADQTTLAFPGPLAPHEPGGALVYSGSGQALLYSSTDSDAFSLLLDAGQRLTVVVDPDADFAPALAVYAPGGALLGSFTAAVGQDALLQNLLASTAGTYTLAIGSAGGTPGIFTVRVLLNAALEVDAPDAANNTVDSAQNLDDSFTRVLAGAWRGAVAGTSDRADGVVAAEIETNDTVATANQAQANFSACSGSFYHMAIAGAISTSSDQDWFKIGALQAGDVITISESGVASSRGTLSDPFLCLYRDNAGSPVEVAFSDDDGTGYDSLIYKYSVTTADTYYVFADAYSSETGTYALGLWLQNAGTAPGTGGTLAAETEANDSAATANDAATSWRPVQYLSQTSGTITSADVDVFSFQLTAGDVLTLNVDSTSSFDTRVEFLNSSGTVIAVEDGTSSGPGADAPLYGLRVPTDGTYYVRVLASYGIGTYSLDVCLSTATPPPMAEPAYDYYSFSLAVGETVTLAVQGDVPGLLQLDLTNAADTVLATALSATSPEAVIHNFSAAPATYYARITSTADTDYRLVLTRNAEFDTEPNDTPSTAQNLDANGTVLGSLDREGDYYRLSVAADEPIYLATSTPGDGAGEFLNYADPRIELYDPSGTLIASDDNGADDGRNAALLLTAPLAGTYTVRVLASDGATGPYVLARTGVAIVISGVSTDVAEGGAGDSYQVVLGMAPTATVTVQLNGGSQLLAVDAANPTLSFLTFTPANWKTPQTVRVSAVDDALREGNASATVTHTLASSDLRYAALTTTVTVNVFDNDETAPQAADDLYAVAANGTLQVPVALGLLVNDTDADGQTLTAVPGAVEGPFHALSFELRSDGSFTYVPAAGFTGTDWFTYNASDAWSTSILPATVVIHVEGPQLVKDINLLEAAANPQNLVTIGRTVFFSATDREHGTELWLSDGSREGTVLVKDIYAGSNSSNPSQLVNLNGMLYFAATNSSNGVELWRSDGTTEGTYLVADIYSGSGGSSPTALTAVGNALYFAASDSSNGTELWRSDGTASGTTLVADIYPGASSSNPANLRNLNGLLLFTANDGVAGTELWRSDGSAAGTQLVLDIQPESTSSAPANLVVAGDTLFFTANDGTSGAELWRSDGSSQGTALVKDIRPGADSSNPASLVNLGGILFFSANDGNTGVELWRSDGTDVGTSLVMDIRYGSASSSPGSLTVVGSTLFFSATDGTSGVELWRSDGYSWTTSMVKDIYAGSNSSSPSGFCAVGAVLYFVAADGTAGRELWQSDGSDAGTLLARDIYPGSSASSPTSLANVHGTLMFCARDDAGNFELWRSDASGAGTSLVADIYRSGAVSSPVGLTTVGNTLFFNANDGITGYELWRSDGTGTGTAMVKDIYAGGSGWTSTARANVNGTLYFAAAEATHGWELWRTDGTEAGTTLVKDVWPGATGSSLTGLCNVGGTLFFWANDGTNGNELWRSDGTAAGTVMVKDITSGSAGSSPRSCGDLPYYLFSTGSLVFFSLSDSTTGYELWRSDGTAAGTYLLKDINAGSGSSSPNYLTDVNGVLYFQANDGTAGNELWRSNGTAAGTYMVMDIYAGGGSAYPYNLTNVNGTLFFRAYGGAAGYELWRSDGTSSGTYLVKDIYADGSSYPSNLTNVNGTLFFQARTSTTGYELWKSDGTEAGTVLVKDIQPGVSPSSPSSIVSVHGRACFLANDGVHGNEIWVSDGTALGTTLLADTGDGRWEPWHLTAAGSNLFYTTDDGITGRELWRAVVNRAPVCADDAYSVNQESSLVVPVLTGVMANDRDPDADAIQLQLLTSTAHGQLVFNADGSFTYVPQPAFLGIDGFTYRAFDGIDYSAETSVSITVSDVNHAPVLDNAGAMTLPAVLEDLAGGSGLSVAALIASAGGDRITDADADALEGLAVIAADNSHGAWQYKFGAGGLWTDFGAPSTASARLLAANTTTWVRFVPAANWNGTVDPGLTFRAWDQTTGTAGETADASTGGGHTAFSSAVETVAVTVTSVNDAPAGANATRTILEDAAYTFVRADFAFSDPADSPANALAAVQIASLPNAGTLTLNGSSVTLSQQVTVADIDLGRLVFTPAANAGGAPYAAFTFQVRDDGGTANGGLNLAPTANSITFHVTPQNDPPVVGTLTVSADWVELGDDLTLVAQGVADPFDPTGSVVSVAFYRESNGVPGLQTAADTLVASDVDSADGWSTTFSTAGLAPGDYTYYALATDNDGARSADGAAATAAASSVRILYNLDADGNGTADALTDGILILRYLFAPDGAWSCSDALGSGATRTSRDQIRSFLEGGRTSVLDADGNGTADALTDGILILRYLFAPDGAWSYSDALGAASTRTSRAAIKAHLAQYDPATTLELALHSGGLSASPGAIDRLFAQDDQDWLFD